VRERKEFPLENSFLTSRFQERKLAKGLSLGAWRTGKEEKEEPVIAHPEKRLWT
jgi:hypothetical protein